MTRATSKRIARANARAMRKIARTSKHAVNTGNAVFDNYWNNSASAMSIADIESGNVKKIIVTIPADLSIPEFLRRVR